MNQDKWIGQDQLLNAEKMRKHKQITQRDTLDILYFGIIIVVALAVLILELRG